MLTTCGLLVHQGRSSDDRVLELFMSAEEVDGLANVDLSKEGGSEEVPDQQSSIGGACDELKKVVWVDDGRGEPRILCRRILCDREQEFRHDLPTGNRENLDGDSGQAEEVAVRRV